MSSLVLIAAGSVILFFPVWVLHAPTAKLAGFEQRDWPSGRNLLLTILDVARASIGARLLALGAAGVPTTVTMEKWEAPLVVSAVIAAGLLIQTLAWRDEDHAFAPVTYVLGVAVALVHPIVLALVLPLALGSAMAVRAWSAGLMAAGFGLSAAGLLIPQEDWRRALPLGLTFCVPVVVSVMAGRHLGWPRK